MWALLLCKLCLLLCAAARAPPGGRPQQARSVLYGVFDDSAVGAVGVESLPLRIDPPDAEQGLLGRAAGIQTFLEGLDLRQAAAHGRLALDAARPVSMWHYWALSASNGLSFGVLLDGVPGQLAKTGAVGVPVGRSASGEVYTHFSLSVHTDSCASCVVRWSARPTAPAFPATDDDGVGRSLEVGWNATMTRAPPSQGGCGCSQFRQWGYPASSATASATFVPFTVSVVLFAAFAVLLLRVVDTHCERLALTTCFQRASSGTELFGESLQLEGLHGLDSDDDGAGEESAVAEPALAAAPAVESACTVLACVLGTSGCAVLLFGRAALLAARHVPPIDSFEGTGVVLGLVSALSAALWPAALRRLSAPAPLQQSISVGCVPVLLLVLWLQAAGRCGWVDGGGAAVPGWPACAASAPGWLALHTALVFAAHVVCCAAGLAVQRPPPHSGEPPRGELSSLLPNEQLRGGTSWLRTHAMLFVCHSTVCAGALLVAFSTPCQSSYCRRVQPTFSLCAGGAATLCSLLCGYVFGTRGLRLQQETTGPSAAGDAAVTAAGACSLLLVGAQVPARLDVEQCLKTGGVLAVLLCVLHLLTLVAAHTVRGRCKYTLTTGCL